MRNHYKYNCLKSSILLFIVTLLWISLSTHAFISLKYPNNDFKYITGNLSKNIVLIKGSKGHKHLEFKLDNFPDFTFRITGGTYEVIKNDNQFINSFTKGQKITIAINKSVYEKKIIKTKALNLLDKYYYYHNINIYQITSPYHRYLIDQQSARKHDTEGNYFLFIVATFFGILFSLASFYNFKSYLKLN